MNRSELIAEVVKKTGVDKKSAEAVILETLGTITATIASGDKVQLNGFGVFETKARAARKGHNPMTGEEIDIPAVTLPSFKPSKDMKAAVKK